MIELLQLSKTYSKGRVRAVKNLSLKVQKGELFGFLGPNGAGKTTTIKMIVGLLRPDNGQVLLNGIDARREPLKAKSIVGYCPDDPVLYDKMSGIRFLAFIADVFGVPAERRAARIQKLAETFEMKVALGDRVGIISRGELAAAAPLEELRRKAGEESATLEKLFLEMTDENAGAR